MSEQPDRAIPLRNLTWTWRAVIVGILGLALGAGIYRGLHPYITSAPLSAAIMLAGELGLLAYAVFASHPAMPLRRELFGSRSWLREGAIAFGTVIATAIFIGVASELMQRVNPGITLENHPFRSLPHSSSRWYVAFVCLLAVGVAPIAEEAFFRGFLYNALAVRLPIWGAAVVQAILFGTSHTVSIEHSVVACCTGLVLALLYEWRKTLLTPVLAHGLINTLGVLGVLISTASFHPTYLGVNGPPDDRGCRVEVLDPNSPADKAGLKLGDIIAAVDGEKTLTYLELRRRIQRHRAGERAFLTVLRDGEFLTIEATLENRTE